MKKNIFLLLTPLFIQFHLSAQINIGIMGGGQTAVRSYNTGDFGIEKDFINSINTGATAFIPISKRFFFHESFGYSGKGVLLKNIQLTDELGNDLGIGNLKILVHYLELRSPITYQMRLRSNQSRMFAVGPYFAYAFGGHHKSEGDNLNSTQRKKHKIDFNDLGYKRFDFGIVVEFLAWFSENWLVTFSGDIGLTEVVKSTNGTIRNTSASVTVTYLFHQKKKD